MSGFLRFKKISGSSKTIYVILALFLAVQLVFTFAPFVNQEYVYGIAAQRIVENGVSSDLGYLSYYFNQVSNPIFSSLLAVPFVAVFGFSEFIVRLPILLLSVLFLFLAYLFVQHYFGRKAALLSVLIVALNPLFWVYSNRIYTDAPFMVLVSLSVMSFIYSLTEKKYVYTVLSGLLLALAFLTKLIANLVYPLLVIILLLYLRDERKLRLRDARFILKTFILRFLPHLAFVLVLVLPYCYLMMRNFGFIMNPAFVSMVFDEGIFIPFFIRFMGYVSWLGIFTGILFPFLFMSFHKNVSKRLGGKAWLVYALIVLFNILLISFTRTKMHFMGEMDFGVADVLLPAPLLLAVLFFTLLAGELLLVNGYFWCLKRSFAERSLFAWIFFLTLVISIARPTQRYLMIVLLPVAILVVHQIGDFRPSSRFLSFFAKLLLVANFIALLLMGLFISSYQVSLGHASADVVEYINEHDLSSGIEYEPKSHAYYLFDDQELYPFEDTSLALRNYSRPYFTGPVSMLDSSEYEVVHSAEVASFGVRLKELAVAKRISPHK